MGAFGPLRTVPELQQVRLRRRIGAPGHSAPLMSPGFGLRPNPPPLLRSTERPDTPILDGPGCWAAAENQCRWKRTLGSRRSEVKEEDPATPGPGGMSGVGCPTA